MIHLGWIVLVSLVPTGVYAADTASPLPAPPPGTKRVFMGFKLTKIDKGSLYEKVGLKEGDLLRTINGQPVISPMDLKLMPEILERDKKVVIKVDRGERKVTLTYTLKTVPVKTARRRAASTP